MTREEAIHILSTRIVPTRNWKEIHEAIDMAIEALAVQESVPTVVRVTMSDGSQYYLEHERDAIQADAVQGEWIKRRNNNYNSHRLTCPKCKRTFIMPKAWGVWKGCPSCWVKLNPPKCGDAE